MVQKLGPVNSVWAVRLSADHGAVAECRLAGRQGQGATHLAEGGVESAAETEAPGALVAERRFLCAAPAGTGESRVELRLRERDDTRRKNAADADADR